MVAFSYNNLISGSPRGGLCGLRGDVSSELGFSQCGEKESSEVSENAAWGFTAQTLNKESAFYLSTFN